MRSAEAELAFMGRALELRQAARVPGQVLVMTVVPRWKAWILRNLLRIEG